MKRIKINSRSTVAFGILFLVFLLTVSGCEALSNVMGFAREGFLAIGANKKDIQMQVDYILGKAIHEFEREDQEDITVLEYNYRAEHNLVLYFYNNIFIEAAFHKTEDYEYPVFRADYKSITKKNPGQIAGYLLINTGEEPKMQILYRKEK